MPASPDDGAAYAAQVAALVDELEVRLLERLAFHLSTVAGDPGRSWERDALQALRVWRTEADGAVRAAERRLLAAVTRALMEARGEGAVSAAADLDKLDVAPGPAASADQVRRRAEQLARRLFTALQAVPRLLEPIYREAVRIGAAEVLGGNVTRLAAAQHVLDRLIGHGITGFRDSAGRNWALHSYVEMAVRTEAGHQAVQGHVDALLDAGIELVVVSDSPRECPKCRPWEGKVLSLTGQSGTMIVPSVTGGSGVRVEVAGTLDEARREGMQHPNCFPGDVLVSVPSGVDAADSRWYEGQLVVIHTAGGDELPVTPNHPVLTPEGWVAAGALQIGQNVLRYGTGRGHEAVGGPHDMQVPARIGDVFHSLRQTSKMPAVRVPAAPEQFHGDGTVDSNVEVVLADRLLQRHRAASLLDQGGDRPLFVGGMGLGPLLAERPFDKVLVGAGHAADRVVSRGREGGSLCRRHAGEAAFHGFGAGKGAVAVAPEPRGEGRLAESDGGRGLALSLLAGQVTLDRVVEVSRRDFAGHVYNLQSGDGWYVASNILVHNCRHSVSAFLPGATTLKRPTSDPAGYEAGQRQRALERKVREAKRREALALDDVTRKRAAAKVREAQAQLRDHVARHDLKRLRRREQIDLAT